MAAYLWQGRYERLEVVGRGSQGEVWKAVDHQHDRLVALKVRKAGTKAARERLLAQVKVLLSLRPHPHLPVVRDDFFVGRNYVMVLDWIEGVDLGQVLDARGDPGLAPTTVIGWLVQIGEALDHLHSHDPPVAHGDVKPANALLTRDGSVVLVDFGISARTARSSPLRSPYQAPEVKGAADPTPAADVFGLAATAAALLTGTPPSDEAPAWDGVRPDVARVLERAIGQGLLVDPARRPATAAELVERMSAFSASPPSGVVTFVVTSVAGVTELRDTDAVATSASLAALDMATAHAVDANGGVALPNTTASDGTVAAFASARAAVSTAYGIAADVSHDAFEPLGKRVVVALATGEVERRGATLAGAALNRAVELASIGHAGQVLLSASTASVVKDSLPEGCRLVEVGKRALGARLEPISALTGPHIPLVKLPLGQPKGAGAARQRRAVLIAVATIVALVVAALAAFVLRGGSDHEDEPPIAVPAPSPRPVMFESNRTGRYDIYAMDSNGAHERLLLHEPPNAAIANAQPELSPDGTRILFDSERVERNGASNIDLYTCASDGSDVRRLTTNPGYDGQASWAPDSRHVVFNSIRGNGNQVYVIDVALGERSIRAVTRTYGVGAPSYSPDGSKIVYNGSKAVGEKSHIYVADANGSNQIGTQLTSGAADDVHPRWAPDGTTLAFSSNRSGVSEIYLVDAARGDTAGITQITKIGVEATDPSWSPDGTFLVFTSTHLTPGVKEVFALPVAARRARRAYRMTHTAAASENNVTWR